MPQIEYQVPSRLTCLIIRGSPDLRSSALSYISLYRQIGDVCQEKVHIDVTSDENNELKK